MIREEKKLKDSLYKLIEDYNDLMELLQKILDRYSEYIFGVAFGINDNIILNPKKPNMEILQKILQNIS